MSQKKFDPTTLPRLGSPKTLKDKFWGRLVVDMEDTDVVGDPKVINEDGIFDGFSTLILWGAFWGFFFLCVSFFKAILI